jgi:hypothetical protein
MTQAITTDAPRKRTLREIVTMLTDVIDLNDGEVTDEVELLELELEQKVEAYRYVMMELEAEADALAELAVAYKARAAIREDKVAALKARLQSALEAAGIDKIKTQTCTAYLQASKSVAIVDEDAFVFNAPDAYVVTKHMPNKTAIKKALEAGEAVEGALLKINRSLRFR